MKESILHYIWQQKIFSGDLYTTENEKVVVIDTGLQNTNAGPDFFNAKIKIDNTVWAGNVEIHTLSSDWNKHNHQSDKSYDSVIIHIVEKADKDIYRTNGSKIPQMELRIPDYVRQNFEELILQEKWVRCADKIDTIPSVYISNWKETLLTERFQEKTTSIKNLLQDNKNHWEESFYIILARNFGFGLNGIPFENLAKSLPLNILAKHKNNLLQIEALLFGQADLLPENPAGDYSRQLQKEYTFLKNKYNLHQRVNKENWKFLRVRPENFPYIRIAQFASLIQSSTKLFSKIIDNPDISYIQSLFTCEPSEYWRMHYDFEKESARLKSKKLGKQSVNIILINTVIPFLFCYALEKNNQELKDKALELLEKIPAEKNKTINEWNNTGIKAENAYDSQALLQLKKEYCDRKKCLRCRIGHKVLQLKTT